MGDFKVIVDAWPVFGSGIGFIAWLVRLESKVGVLRDDLIQAQKDLRELRAKHDALDSGTLKELGKIREALARIEGRLSATVDG